MTLVCRRFVTAAMKEAKVSIGDQHFDDFDLIAVLKKIHRGSHSKLRQLKLRFGLDYSLSDSISLCGTISRAFPEGLPALQSLEMNIIFQLFQYSDWPQTFLNDVADLDEVLLDSLPHSLRSQLSNWRWQSLVVRTTNTFRKST